MKSIGEVLTHTLKKSAYLRKISEALIFIEYPRLVGDKIAMVTRPLKFSHGTLFIGVESPVWSHHLHYLKPDLLKKLNSPLDKKLIKDIKFQICKLDRGYNVNRVKTEKRMSDMPVPRETLKKIEDLCQQIEDVDLRKSFSKLMTKDAKYKLTKTQGRTK